MTAIYICDQNPTLKIKIRKTKMRFEDKKLELTDEEDIKFMDEVMRTKPHVAALVRKLDIEAAEKIAREHRQQMILQNAAHKGTATSAMERIKQLGVQDEMLGQIDESDPAAKAALDEIIRKDPNATELEKANLEQIEKEQQAKIEAELAAKKAAEEAEAKPKFNLDALTKRDS